MSIQFYSGLKKGYQDFSNFAKAPFTVRLNGQQTTFPTVEHYFHHQKANLFNDRSSKIAILNTPDPLQAKRVGRQVNNFDPKAWNAAAEKHIANGMYLKFSQHPDLKEKLLATGNEDLLEANPYDSTYGIGRDGKGQNLTGKCLMRVRELFQEQALDLSQFDLPKQSKKESTI